MFGDNLPAGLPDGIWDSCEYTSIHATILIVELEDKLAAASMLLPHLYNAQVDEFQRLVLEETGNHRKHSWVAEVYLNGFQARIYLYNVTEVDWNRQLDGPEALTGSARNRLIDTCRDSKETITYEALRLAIKLNFSWLATEFNKQRVRSHLNPLSLGIGIHTGRAFLTRRPDGRVRLEGNAIELAERVQACCRHSRHSHIMVSARTREYICRKTVADRQLSQNVYFHNHELKPQEIQGFLGSETVSELRFFHLIGVHLEHQDLPFIEAIFNLDRANNWAYNLLADHYGYIDHDWQKMYQLARRAHSANPHDEKVLHDLGRYFLKLERLTLARKFAEEAIAVNPRLNLGWELLAHVSHLQDDQESQVRCWREAVFLNPESPVNNFNLGLAIMLGGQKDEGFYFVQEALRIYPEYVENQRFRETLTELKNLGRLPREMEIYLEYIPDKEQG